MEDFVFGSLQTYADGWKLVNSRAFNDKEISAVRSNTVIESQYGKSVCFFMASGGQKFIPLSKNSDLELGTSVNLKEAKLITLEREGDGKIIRVEA